jgi:hypothetical protein
LVGAVFPIGGVVPGVMLGAVPGVVLGVVPGVVLGVGAGAVLGSVEPADGGQIPEALLDADAPGCGATAEVPGVLLVGELLVDEEADIVVEVGSVDLTGQVVFRTGAGFVEDVAGTVADGAMPFDPEVD